MSTKSLLINQKFIAIIFKRKSLSELVFILYNCNENVKLRNELIKDQKALKNSSLFYVFFLEVLSFMIVKASLQKPAGYEVLRFKII